MQKKLNWNAYTNDNRHEIIEGVKNVISCSDGCILNFNLFSDLALSLCIEIEEAGIAHLHSALKSIVDVSDIGVDHDFRNSKREWLIFINLSFGKGKGQLKTTIPDVPG